jgi:hypothetical protein
MSTSRWDGGKVVVPLTLQPVFSSNMPLAKCAAKASTLNSGAYGTARWKQVAAKQLRLGKYSEIIPPLLKADLEQDAMKPPEPIPITLMYR